MAKEQDDSLTTFKLLTDSRQPIIFVETYEEIRVLKELVYALNVTPEEDDKRSIFTFDMVRGVCQVSLTADGFLDFQQVTNDLLNKWRSTKSEETESSGSSGTRGQYRNRSSILDITILDSDPRSPFAAPVMLTINAIRLAKSLFIPNVFIFLDIHEEMTPKSGGYNPRSVRAFKDLAFAIKYQQQDTYKTIVMLSPTIAIPTEIDKLTQLITFDLPKRDQLTVKLRKMLETFLEEHLDDTETDDYNNHIKSLFELSSETIHEIIQSGLGLTLSEFEQAVNYSVVSDLSVNPVVVQTFKESMIKKSGKLEFIKPIPMNQLGGLDIFKEYMDIEKHALTEAAQQAGSRLSRGILCIGYAGTGKSLGARCASAKLGIPLLRLDMSNIMGGLVGLSEQNIKKAFQIAKANAPCILQIDEIEKALAGSESSGRSDAGTTSRVKATLLTEMAECDEQILFLATCNGYDQLAPEDKRRFGTKIFFDFPDSEAREAVIKIHLMKVRSEKHKLRKLEEFDIETLVEATRSFTPAEIEEVILRGIRRGNYLHNNVFTTEDILFEGNTDRFTPMYVMEKDNSSFNKLRDVIRRETTPASTNTLETELDELTEREKERRDDKTATAKLSKKKKLSLKK